MVNALPLALMRGGAASYMAGLARLFADAGYDIHEVPVMDRAPVMPHRARQVSALITSACTTRPSKPAFHIPPGGIGRVRRRIERLGPDLVLLGNADLLPVAERGIRAPVILVAHNIEHRLYADQVAHLTVRSGLLGAFFRRDLKRLTAMELAGMARMDGIIAISTEDAAWIRANVPKSAPLAIPPIFQGPLPQHSRPRPARPLRLAYVAKLSWWPNRRGLDWFVDAVLDHLPPGSVELNVYGPGSEHLQGRHSALTGHGFIDDLDAVWRDNHIAICPIFEGSGVNVKFAEAVFNGMPVLATSYATRGLDWAEDPAVLRLDSAEEWRAILVGDRALDFAARIPQEESRLRFGDAASARALARMIAELTAHL